ncbi:MAG: hypothetical protein NC094_11210 [Bacteroidales bacterium]|nr:hypothetical protein [Lachnoclostridium sp.]MCM1385342.1 hypothetical protein [Lachnoclostridium sp.]MCM1465977.1 hypothetical protein [Bacteroidales bacterium]
MRRKLLWFFTAGVFMAAMVFGMVKKQTYKNLVAQENYLEQLYVAELSEDLTERACAAMSRSLPDAAIILRVEAVGEIEHLYRGDRQKVVIKEVYAGSELEKGKEMYIVSDHWHLSLKPTNESDGYDRWVDSIQRGFVNIMEVGTEYLVFGEAVTEDRRTGEPAVKLYDDFFIAPVFSYEGHPNVIVPISEDDVGIYGTAVPYKDVKDNEFFATSEKGMQMMEDLKSRMLALYPGEIKPSYSR